MYVENDRLNVACGFILDSVSELLYSHTAQNNLVMF